MTVEQIGQSALGRPLYLITINALDTLQQHDDDVWRKIRKARANPRTMSVDGRLPLTDSFASGLWAADAQSASAAGSAVIAHGGNVAGTSRLTVFAMNPLYRADPEREWLAAASAAYWAGR